METTPFAIVCRILCLHGFHPQLLGEKLPQHPSVKSPGVAFANLEPTKPPSGNIKVQAPWQSIAGSMTG